MISEEFGCCGQHRAGFGCRLVVNNAPYPGLLDFILFQASSTSTLQGSAIVDLNTGDQVEVQMPDYDSQFERIGRADPEQSICLSPAYQILKPQSGFTSGAGSLLASKVGLFLASAEVPAVRAGHAPAFLSDGEAPDALR